MNLEGYKSYLKAQKYRPKTIQTDCNNLNLFVTWFESIEESELAQLTAPILLEYVNYLQGKQLAISTINIRIRSIKKYLDHLKDEGLIKSNVAEGLHIKGTVKKVVIDPLEFSELEQLYVDYSKHKKKQLERLNEGTARITKAAGEKRKLMLGFMIFQGLHTGELKRLEINHINDEEGTIYIAGSGRTKARHLKLQPAQMRVLFQQLTKVKEASLFEKNVYNQMAFLCEELRGINQKVQNGLHIRASVIMHWLKLHGKRQTQYMIGHKWISSTEHYELQDLETLTNELDKHHPLRSPLHGGS